jgi:hypothetical protein
LLIVLLNEEDVPGAKFVSDEVSEHSIVQLAAVSRFEIVRKEGNTGGSASSAQMATFKVFYHYT